MAFFLLLAQVTFAGVVMAAPVAVDFSVLGPPTNDPPLTVDITTAVNTDGFTLDGVTFRYDDFGSGIDFGLVDPAGVFGTTGGGLFLDFAIPASSLALDFYLYDAFSADGDGMPMADALFALFFANGSFLDLLTVAADFFAYDPLADQTLGMAFATLAYQGPAFDQAVLYFSLDAPIFSVDNLIYEPIPEPSTIVLLTVGLVGLIGLQRKERNRRSVVGP